jgi:hypothetical protein
VGSARGEISTAKNGRVPRADIVVMSPADTVELIGHEIEHVIERMEGVRLRQQGCLGNTTQRDFYNPAVSWRSGAAWGTRGRGKSASADSTISEALACSRKPQQNRGAAVDRLLGSHGQESSLSSTRD